MPEENKIKELEKEIAEKDRVAKHAEKLMERIVNGKAEDKSKIEVLKDLFPERNFFKSKDEGED